MEKRVLENTRVRQGFIDVATNVLSGESTGAKVMRKARFLDVFLAMAAWAAWADEPGLNQNVPITSRGKATYYVEGDLKGFGKIQLLVDTGSGYTAIDETTLAILKEKGSARYLKELRGVMADGSRRVVPVYLLTSLNIGGKCEVRDVEAVIFPADTRPILGLNTLIKVSPFTFSINPPRLMLSNCERIDVPGDGDFPAIDGDKLAQDTESISAL
jgi:predicted aspartyl protease